MLQTTDQMIKYIEELKADVKSLHDSAENGELTSKNDFKSAIKTVLKLIVRERVLNKCLNGKINGTYGKGKLLCDYASIDMSAYTELLIVADMNLDSDGRYIKMYTAHILPIEKDLEM